MILEFYKFACSSLPKFIGVFILTFMILGILTSGLTEVLSKLFRTINILVRGWPPDHINADGTFDDEI